MRIRGGKRARILLVEEDIRSFIVRFDGNDQSNSFPLVEYIANIIDTGL